MYLYLVEHVCRLFAVYSQGQEKKETIPVQVVSKVDTRAWEKYIFDKATFPLTKR